ncbi:MAG: ATP-grasp domain-containing protein, partial [Psychroserpens sp.]|nr:ATP-grasp domain-containing protein [Psychroserpens sp.]
YSKFTSYYKYYERPSDEEWKSIVTQEVKANQIDVIVPIAEKEIRFFIANLDHFQSLTAVIPLPGMESFEIAIDKYQLSRFLETNNISHPKSLIIQKGDMLNEESFPLQFPVLMKPIHDKGGDGIERIDHFEALVDRINSNPDRDQFFIQEFINGFDIDCSVICESGNLLAYTVQKGNLVGHSPYAPQLGFQFFRNDEVLQTVKTAMEQLNWSGVAHIDLRYDERSKDYKIIEINARFWGSIDGSRVAGVNFPDLAIQLATHGSIGSNDFKDAEYMRLKGVLKSIKRDPSLLLKRKFLMDQTEVSSFLKDPMPIGYKFIEWLTRPFV